MAAADLVTAANDLLTPANDSSTSADLATDDGGTPLDYTIYALQPFGFESNLPSSGTRLSFVVNLQGSTTQQQVEATMKVVPRGGSTPIAGAWSWQQGPSLYLAFTPSASLAAGDYVVSSVTAGVTRLKVGYTVGSHPRVIGASLSISGPSYAAGFGVQFSEDIDPTSATGKITFLSNGTPIAGSGMFQSPGTNQYVFSATDPATSFSDPIEVVIAPGLTAASPLTTPLDTSSWDSPTKQADGSFRVALPMIPFNMDTGSSWTAIVN